MTASSPPVPLAQPRRTYSVKDAARLLGVGHGRLLAAIRAGAAPVRAIELEGRFLIPKADLDRLLAGERGEVER